MPAAAIAAAIVTAVLVAAVAAFLAVVVVLLVRIVRTLDDVLPAVRQVADRAEPLEGHLAPIEEDLRAMAATLSGGASGASGPAGS